MQQKLLVRDLCPGLVTLTFVMILRSDSIKNCTRRTPVAGLYSRWRRVPYVATMAFPLELRFASAVGVGETFAAALPCQGMHGFDAQLLSLVAATPAPASLEHVVAQSIPCVASLAAEPVGRGRSMIGGAQTSAAVLVSGLLYARQAVGNGTTFAKSGIRACSAPVPLFEDLVAHRFPPVAGRAFERVMIATSLPHGCKALSTVLGGLSVEVDQTVL